MSDSGCPFCVKLSQIDQLGEDELVWSFPHSIALLGPWQRYHGYCVLVSRRHERELFDLPEEVRRAYLDEMCLLARAIDRAFGPHKLNYELLGNQVPHLHWHLFPRYQDDPARLAPVWLTIDAAERDPQKNKELRTGPRFRAVTISELRHALISLGAQEP